MEVAAGIITIIGLIVGWWLKKDNRTPSQKIVDDVERQKNERSKLKGDDLSLNDYERRELVRLLLRYQKHKSSTK